MRSSKLNNTVDVVNDRDNVTMFDIQEEDPCQGPLGEAETPS